MSFSANFFYDALKVVFRCTAFAIDAGDAILHDTASRKHFNVKMYRR
jgi:hypothetical protein